MPLVSFAEAVATLRAGGLVAIPTETVYGLAANALDEAAVHRIFTVKKRPSAHPLILHSRDPRPFARFDARADRLAAFWPGPLTLVLPLRSEGGVAASVTGGGTTLAVRAPDHPLALALLDTLSFPLAAPSANRFGAVSPTTAAHVLASFPDLPTLDGGPCAVGVESTILDLTGPAPALLRPGGIPAEALTLALGEEPGGPSSTPAPGTLPAHYAPRAKVVVSPDAVRVAATLRGMGLWVAEISALEPREYARVLYARMRQADAEGADVLVCEPAAEEGLGCAVNDRLLRAQASSR